MVPPPQEIRDWPVRRDPGGQAVSVLIPLVPAQGQQDTQKVPE